MKIWKWVDEELPKHTGDYNVFCSIGSVFGGFDTVRTYRYQITNTKGVKEAKWILPDTFDEVVIIEAWAELPDKPIRKEKE